MPFYHQLGKIPHKRHTVFKKPDGSLYYEQLFGTIGFDGMSSLIYHQHRPTQVKSVKKVDQLTPEIAETNNLTAYIFKGFEVKPEDDYLKQ